MVPAGVACAAGTAPGLDFGFGSDSRVAPGDAASRAPLIAPGCTAAAAGWWAAALAAAFLPAMKSRESHTSSFQNQERPGQGTGDRGQGAGQNDSEGTSRTETRLLLVIASMSYVHIPCMCIPKYIYIYIYTSLYVPVTVHTVISLGKDQSLSQLVYTVKRSRDTDSLAAVVSELDQRYALIAYFHLLRHGRVTLCHKGLQHAPSRLMIKSRGSETGTTNNGNRS